MVSSSQAMYLCSAMVCRGWETIRRAELAAILAMVRPF